jgi:uncharacterized protein (DUF1330 family)
MKAYIIVDVTIQDPILYEDYKKLTPASIHSHEGKFLVRGGKTETIEGDWAPGRFVILEFPSIEKAREWYRSEGYTQAKSIRQRAAHTQMILAEGCE